MWGATKRTFECQTNTYHTNTKIFIQSLHTYSDIVKGSRWHDTTDAPFSHPRTEKKVVIVVSPCPPLCVIVVTVVFMIHARYCPVQSLHCIIRKHSPDKCYFCCCCWFSCHPHTFTHHMMISLVSKCNGTSSGGNSNNKTIPVTRDRLWWKKYREKVDSYHHSSGRYNQSIVWQWAQ